MARITIDPRRMRLALQSALVGPADSGDAAPPPPQFYTPLAHVKAIDPSYPLVIGGRGAGKSVWWNALLSPQHRAAIAQGLHVLAEQGLGRYDGPLQVVQSADVVAGYGESPERLTPSLPTCNNFAELLSEGFAPEAVWRAIIAWLTWGDSPESPLRETQDWRERTTWIAQNPSQADSLFVAYDRALESRQTMRLLVFDSIDRSANDWDQFRAITRGLLRSVLQFRNYRGLRLKAFLRPDIYSDPAVFAFPDASKLRQNAVELRWDPTDLYTLLWQRLANDNEHGDWFRIQTHRFNTTLQWRQTEAGVWAVPRFLRVDPQTQESVLHEITGPRVSRSKPYKWLIQELKDATNYVSPRSLLNALRIAADVPAEDTPNFALTSTALEHGLREAAALRTDEIAEDFPWIGAAIKALRDVVTPVAFSEVRKIWKRKDVISRIEEVCKASGKLLPRRIKEEEDGLRMDLVEIGLFIDRDDGRIDVPEVARIGFGLRRRGGVKPSRART